MHKIEDINKNYRVIVPCSVYPLPSKDELSAATILLDYFKSDIIFIPRRTYSTPDFEVNGEIWELKTPRGKGKYNIQHAMRSALRQSDRIVIDIRFHKMNATKAIRDIKHQAELSQSKLKRLIVITKFSKKVLEII